LNIKKSKRGRRKGAQNMSKSVRFLGVNAAGLRSKLLTFRKIISELKPSVFFIEESKYKEEGKLKLENYVIFELVREHKEGGGLALGCVKELKPVLVRKGNDDIEAVSINIFFKSMKTRCVVAYGCQENSSVEKKTAFWSYIEEEVTAAWESDSGFILHFDGNLWAGPHLVPGDPRPQNNNGKLFMEFLSRQPHLTVVNALSICEGVITRSRTKDGVEEKSVLDFFVVCARVLPYVTKMVIDEDKKYILTNYGKKDALFNKGKCNKRKKGVPKINRKGFKAIDSDHFTQYMDVNLELITEKPERKEVFNFHDKKSQAAFKEITSNTDEFSKCFQNNLPLQKQVNKWRHVLKSYCYKAFRRIRINKKKPLKPMKPNLTQLVDRRNALLKNKNQPENEKKIEELERTISSIEAKENRDFIVHNFKQISENPENVNLKEVWKVLKKIEPKHKSSLPIAKRNHKGILVSSPYEIKKLLSKEYKQRLRSRPLRPDMGNLKERRKKIFKMQLNLAELNKSPPWKISDLNKALADLKKNKSRDHAGYINEIFKEEVIGIDLKNSLLILLNKLKLERLIPDFMNFANITTVPKRGSLMLLDNERGIFRVDIIRCILMRLIYNEKYPVVDRNMSDSQMGGRKGKGCRNNIFIVNGIISDVLKSKKKKPVMLQIYDYAQMFDSINLEQAISDIYEAGLKDENLSLLYKANKEIFMAVNTPNGLTDRQKLENIVLQGDTFGSILASVQVDSIGQECSESGYGYKYMDILPVGLLGLVDDIIGVSEAGFQAQMMNSFINIKTAEKGLQFGVKKCTAMLIGKNKEHVISSDLYVDKWTVEHRDNFVTGDTDLVETYSGQVKMSNSDEQKYLGFILSSSGDNMANIRMLKNKSIGTIRKIFTKLNKLSLQNYYFEVGMIFMNVMLRSSILYASETYYNLKETEIRQIERIEEGYMRQLLKTSRGCSITQIYLELGQVPARFDIFKLRLFFLKYILVQDEASLIYKFFYLQVQNPSKGDWASSCTETLQNLKINLSFEEIKLMSAPKFKKIVCIQIREEAFRYLKNKRGEKGSEIIYQDIEMAEYLLPDNCLSIDSKRQLFSIRNRMVNISSNFSSKQKNKSLCFCGNYENMKHIYECKYWNMEEPVANYEQIYTGTMNQQIDVFTRFEKNWKKREQYLNSNESDQKEGIPDHAISYRDPLISVLLDTVMDNK
jgi:hypothetical protein